LYEVPLLSRDQEVHLFRKMNYLKYKASELRTVMEPSRPNGRLMTRIERLYDEAVATKNRIISANLRLVVSIAKRRMGPAHTFFELVSDGNMSLIRAVERFDYARGYKFSTYATWAIIKNFARTIPNENRQQDRFRTSHAKALAVAEEKRTSWYEQESAQLERKAQVRKMLKRLDDRERRIIVARFGLIPGEEPLTLKQTGDRMGVTKERIRQIVARALDKLRRAAQEERIDVTQAR
jgi:RNA polymerase sigma factor (sigma-70 family)